MSMKSFEDSRVIQVEWFWWKGRAGRDSAASCAARAAGPSLSPTHRAMRAALSYALGGGMH
jgi:hypothetical protein